MKPKGSAHDNTAAGIQRRAQYAEQSLRLEARMVAADVGGSMAVCALLGVAGTIARESGVSKAAYQALLIEVLYHLNRGDTP